MWMGKSVMAHVGRTIPDVMDKKMMEIKMLTARNVQMVLDVMGREMITAVRVPAILMVKDMTAVEIGIKTEIPMGNGVVTEIKDRMGKGVTEGKAAEMVRAFLVAVIIIEMVTAETAAEILVKTVLFQTVQ